jgi:hypothetical protein
MTATVIAIGPMAVLNRYTNVANLATTTPVDVLAALATALNDPNLKDRHRLFVARLHRTCRMRGDHVVYVRTLGRNTVFGIDDPLVTRPDMFLEPATTEGGEVLMPDEVYVFEVRGDRIHHYCYTYGDTEALMAEAFKDADTTGC